MMGLSANTLGNHEFDSGQEYLRTELIPLANFPYVAANAIDPATGLPPAEWKPSHIFEFDGFKLGVVGFTLPELPTLIFPGNLDPFVVTDPVAAVNAEVAKLKSQNKLNAVIVFGHQGANLGTVTMPDLTQSPLVDIANGLVDVPVIIGGHTHTQYVATLPNGMLLNENVNAGYRFSRIRLVVDTKTKAIIYQTGDYHKPWNIGVTPDPAIQAVIDDLNAQLAPIFSTVIGSSSRVIPRCRCLRKKRRSSMRVTGG